VECAALDVGEIIAFVIGHEVDDGPFGQGRRLVEDQSRTKRPFSTWARRGLMCLL
jgi:hypothetical protein